MAAVGVLGGMLLDKEKAREEERHERGMMCFLLSRQICQVKDSPLLRRRICGLLKCIKTFSSPFYVVFSPPLPLVYLAKVEVILLCSSLN